MESITRFDVVIECNGDFATTIGDVPLNGSLRYISLVDSGRMTG
jgi:hypothetical protein